MSKIEELEKIKKELEKTSAEADVIHQRTFELENSAYELIVQVLLEEKILADTKWGFKIARISNPYLEYLGSPDDKVMSKIKELCWDGCNDDFIFEEGIYLRFDVNRMSLHFKNIISISEYIRKLKLEVDISPIRTAVSRQRQDLITLERLCHQLNIKT